MSQNYTVVGTSPSRVESMTKVSGQAKFAADVDLPGMLYAKFLHSPYAHATINSIDTSAASALSGVKAVFTYKDIPHTLYGALSDLYLITDKARYVGDEVAVVAATSENIAEDALDLIKVDYSPLPFYLDPASAMASGATAIHPEISSVKNNTITGAPLVYTSGNTTTGFSQAYKTYEVDNFVMNHVHHSPLESHAVVASWTRDSLTIYLTTVDAFRRRRYLSGLLGVPISNLRVIAPYCGSSFGNKGSAIGRHDPVAALLSKATGLPVKLQYTREEEEVSAPGREKAISTSMKVGFKQDGTITACEYHVLGDAGAYCMGGSGIFLNTNFMLPYKNRNVYYDASVVYTNTPPECMFRGSGKEVGNFPFQIIMDMAAEDLGMDVLDLNAKNYYQVGDTFGTNTFNTCAVPDCVTQGAAKIGWKSKRIPPSQKTGAIRTGIGMAVGVRNGSQSYSDALVKVECDGSIGVINGKGEEGQGIMTTVAQVAAEALNANFSDVTVSPVDTYSQPYAVRSGGSMGFMSNGKAVYLACQDAKAKILAKAAPMLGVTAAELSLGPRLVYVTANPSKSVALGTVVGLDQDIIGIGTVPTGGFLIATLVVFAEVQVDTTTGKVLVTNLVSANDMGTPINPVILRSQAEGGNVQGIGTTMTEGRILDPTTGAQLNGTFLNYKIPTILDFGTVDGSLWTSTNDPLGPYGAVGGMESSLMSPTPAILNAIYNATGKRITEVPVKPSVILKALGGS
jgi:xanthine dehydrogenase molybdenum-binding subunit